MNKLKYYREKAGLSQNELASILDVTQRYIAFLETGERTPSLYLAQKIATYFKVSIEDIFLIKKCTKSTQNINKGEMKNEQITNF